MDKAVFEKIVTAQECLLQNPEHKLLLAEYEQIHEHFLEQVKTMNEEQRSAVWDYCGMLIEIHLHTLEVIAS